MLFAVSNCRRLYSQYWRMRFDSMSTRRRAGYRWPNIPSAFRFVTTVQSLFTRSSQWKIQRYITIHYTIKYLFFFLKESIRSLNKTTIWFSLQVLINSTITSATSFTKTSHKFGQWTDAKVNTVYGLGFASENDVRRVSIFIKI